MKRNLIIILLHVLFWALNLVRNLAFNVSYTTFEIICDQLVIAAICYINYFFFVPYILKKSSILYYILGLFIFISCFTVIYAVWTLLQTPLFGIQELDNSLYVWLISYNISFLYGAVSTGSRLAYDWNINQEKNKALIIQKMSTQIQLMKSNVNLPFLLKVLDYTEKVSKDNPSKAEQPIVLISDVLRYGLYESESAATSLSKEIEIIQEYLDLQKLINPSVSTPLVMEEVNKPVNVIPNLLLRMISLWRVALDKSEQTFVYPIQLQSAANCVILNLPIGLISMDELKNIVSTFNNFSNEQFLVQSEQQTDQLQLKISTIVS